MRGIEQVVIIVLFVGVIALPFSRIIEFTHSKQSAEEKKLTQKEIAQQQKDEEAMQLQRLIDLIPKSTHPKKWSLCKSFCQHSIKSIQSLRAITKESKTPLSIMMIMSLSRR